MIKRILCCLLVSVLIWGCEDGRETEPPRAATPHEPVTERRLTGEELGKKLSLHHVEVASGITPIFQSTFLGFPILEHPADMWIIQEMITEVRPDFIIETGTFAGGSALYYASVLREVHEPGKVITIDIAPLVDDWLEKSKANPDLHQRIAALFHDHIEVITSNSVDPKLVNELASRVEGKRVMVMLDSCHNYEHVLKELELYSPLVSVGSYLIVQDTIIDEGIAVGSELMTKAAECPGYDKPGGPGKAAQEFLATNKNFEVDKSRERFLVTLFPSGYLKRIQ